MSAIKVFAFKAEYRGTGENAKRIDWVNIGPVGLVFTNTTWYRVSELNPANLRRNDRDPEGISHAAMERRWAYIEKHYEAWLKGQELPLEGTPLAAWGGISKEVAEAFIKAGVRTVEEVAALRDSDKGRIPVPGVHDYIKAAKSFLDNAGRVDTDERMKALEANNSKLADELKAATELLEQLTKGKRQKDAA